MKTAGLTRTGLRPEHRWALFERTTILDPADPSRRYLGRLRVIETPWFACFLHRFDHPDSVRHLHDHPWSFVSVVLRGGYDELFATDFDRAVEHADGDPAPIRRWRAGSAHRIRRGEFHAISQLERRPTWTLLFVGPRRQDWGFAASGAFIDHVTYERTSTAGASPGARPAGASDSSVGV